MKPLKLKRIGKKGQIGQIPLLLLIVVVMFAVAMTTFFAHKAYVEFADKAASTGTFEGYEASELVIKNGQNVINGMDFLFVMIFVFMGVALIIAAYMFQGEPIFFFILLLAFIIILVVGGMLANIFTDFTSEQDLANQTQTFSKTTFIMDNYLLFILVAVFAAVIVFYAKLRSR